MIGGPSCYLFIIYSYLTYAILPDNPASDIAGANAHGWESVLVETGVYDPVQGALPPELSPTHSTHNVEAAVHWAIGREAARLGMRS